MMADYSGRSSVAVSGTGSASKLMALDASRQAFVQRAYEHHRRHQRRLHVADADATDVDDDDDEDEEDDEDAWEHCGRLVDKQAPEKAASPHASDLFANLIASNPAVPATQLLGGSFQFIVQEQAKSMVAIQELQQEVNSLLLFRQAVLAALPHLNPAPQSTNAGSAPPSGKPNQTWTRRKHSQQQHHQPYPSLTSHPQATTAHHQIVDSGFSTEASNASNTSPRSSRFETGDVTVATPGEKELVQHLERIQQRMVRLKKDEDRLLNLLNPKREKQGEAKTVAAAKQHVVAGDEDELWRLLDEIQLRSQTLREDKRGVDGAVERVDAATETSDEWTGAKGLTLDRDQVASVLRLTSPVQLQKRLLCALLDNKKLKAQVEASRSESARIDAQWQTSSQSVAEQVTALRDENDDLRFQLEEQKIELEGTKARLRMVTSSSFAAHKPSPVTSVKVRASSTQTERAAPSPTKWTQGTQTEQGDDSPSAKLSAAHLRSFVPRVIDASPKPRGSAKFEPNRSGQWADEEDRPSVERRSYTSRIPTPIKPTVIPIVSSPSSYSSGGKWAVSSPPRRELPDTPNAPPAAPKQPLGPSGKKDGPQTILMTPVQKSRSSPVVHATSERSRNSPENLHNGTNGSNGPNNNNGHNNHKMRLSLSSASSSSASSSSRGRLMRADERDEYYDSINANGRSPLRNRSRYATTAAESPVDSLESNGPNYGAPYRADAKLSGNKRGSYSTESSTPPSNSLTSHS